MEEQGWGSRGFALLAILILFSIYTAVSIPVVTILAKWSQPLGELGYLAGPLVFALMFTICNWDGFAKNFMMCNTRCLLKPE